MHPKWTYSRQTLKFGKNGPDEVTKTSKKCSIFSRGGLNINYPLPQKTDKV
uniref:Uncharacterized protein n=1 Tax=Meloidogyne incognita TaxID=6306 RepID=A0A914LBK5_MELIC